MRILRSILILCQIAVFFKGSKSSPLLLYANRKDIRLVDAGDNKNNSTIIISDLQDVAAVDFIFRDQTIYWTDITKESIQRTSVNESQIFIDASEYKPSREGSDIITTGLLSPDGLACDWLTHKLYWTDSDNKQIEVSTLDGSIRKVLFWQDLDQPRAIAVDPIRGYVYWTDWGELPKIERAGMDGNHSSRSVLVKDNIFWPNGLTLDYIEERVFWMDAKLSYIHSIKFDGSDRQVVLEESSPHPFAITLLEDHLYWTDWETKAIYTCDKHTGLDKKMIHSNIWAPMDIHVFDPKKQPTGVNPCGLENGGCSHLCLMSPVKPYYTCACPTGVLLQPDRKTCAPGPLELLLLVRRPDIRRISLDTPDFTDLVLPLTNIKHAIAIDYDPIEGYFYWTDDEVKMISRARLNGSDQEVLLSHEIHHPDGVAVDWIARNMYWTDTGTNRIEVARLNGTSRRVLITENLQEPRAIALDPLAGHIYWTDWGDDPKIERANLDGTQRVVLVNESLGWPNGIALDLHERMIFWGDAREDKIEGMNMNGTNRRVLLDGDTLPHIFGFSLLDDYIYWTDWQRRSVQRINKFTGKDRQIVIEELSDVMGLKAVNIAKPKGTNPCALNNNGCSHLCLYRPQGPICACPIGYELVQDGKTCLVPDAFLLFSRRVDIRRISLETTENNDVAIPLSGVKEAIALDFDIHDKRIYWTDVELHSISRAFMNGSALEHIIQFGLNYPEGMAVDWIARNLYWADTGTKRIEMSRLDGTSRKVLVWMGLESPRSIALDPSQGYMYWSDWDKPARIERATLDGNERTTLLSNMGRANGLTIDFNEKKIYWTDIDNNKIVSSNMDGSEVHTVVNEMLPQPYSLTQFEDFIYWADWNLKTIERVNKTSGENRSVIQNNLNYVMDLLVFHSSRQSGWNPCANVSKCSHLCVAHPTESSQEENATYHCTCPTHFQLLDDGKTCKGPETFLLYSMKTSISRMLFDAKDAPDIILPLQGPKNIRSIAYDPIEQYIYWVDGKAKEVKRAKENTTDFETVIDNDNRDRPSAKNPFDIALDPYGRYLYWSDDKENVINVTSLAGSKFWNIGTVVSGKDIRPRKLALDPLNGYLFWVNTVNPARIEKSLMDGSLPSMLFESDLGKPSALTVDPDNKKIYWADSLLKKIEVANYDGSKRRTLKDTDISEPVGLAVLGDYLYWIDKAHQSISRMRKDTGEESQVIQGRVSQLSDLDFVRMLSQVEQMKHPCAADKNGNCSHLCFLEGAARRCSCPEGLKLSADMETCSLHTMCKETDFECVRDSKCIPSSWRCDKEADCSDESDELNCRECTAEEFRCGNGMCIPHIQRCDRVANCAPVASDEENCYPCKADDFVCDDDVCLDGSKRCNGEPDCREGEDEHECPVVGAPESSSQRRMQPQISALIVLGVVFLAVIVVVISVLWCKKKREPVPQPDDMNGIIMVAEPYKCHYIAGGGSSSLDHPTPPPTLSRGKSGTTTCLTVTSGNSQSSGSLIYDRNHVTGASSSSSCSASTVTHYPHETLNPPPSPVTDRSHAACDVFSFTSQSPSTTRSYRQPQSGKALRRHHYNYHHHHHHHNHGHNKKDKISDPYHRNRQQLAPPTTPCSTDVCDDSEPYALAGGARQYYPLSSDYSNFEDDESEAFYPQPPPTPRSQGCFSAADDELLPSLGVCRPSSPSTERSFFNPYPPPPSPVAMSDC